MAVTKVKFIKMEGCGNDYLFINSLKKNYRNPKRMAKLMSDRHFGAGADGIILILPSRRADIRMRIFNADGSEGEMCGNGVRCLAKYVYDLKIKRKKELVVETGAGIRRLNLHVGRNGMVDRVRVNMGEPDFTAKNIPVNTPLEKFTSQRIELPERTFEATAVSMGNPHLVIYVNDIYRFPVQKYGPQLERHPLFPNRTNVEFIQVENRKYLKQRTWERGSGETLACGTGASAALAVGYVCQMNGKKVTVELTGGKLDLEWARDNNIYMTGPANFVYEGEFPL